jgi:hypothetical protein
LELWLAQIGRYAVKRQPPLQDRGGSADQVSDFWGSGNRAVMALVLWIIAVILVVAGILALFRRQFIWGIVLIIVGLLVGPGGVSIFT